MRFLIDANLPRSIIELIASLGHEGEFARDTGLAAAPDSEIAARAETTGAALLTRDLDFSDIRRYPPALYYGIGASQSWNRIASASGLRSTNPSASTRDAMLTRQIRE
jgi:hypothetical protein